MLISNRSYLGIWTFTFLLLLGFNLPVKATPLSAQEILDQLKTHQEKVKIIEADFSLSIFGVDGMTIKQRGQYTYHAPGQVLMKFTEPNQNIVKVSGDKVEISINNGPFTSMPQNEAKAGMNSDLFQYHFLRQFYLEIDDKNQPGQSGLVKVIGYHKDAEGGRADEKTVRNAKAVEFLYDTGKGLVRQINFMGFETVPPMELKLGYENREWIWVPKKMFARIITPGGDIASAIVLANKKVEKK